MLRETEVESQTLLLAHKECRLLLVPYGVVLVITPWNYPFSIPLICAATALAAGNTVVLKPAPATTLAGLKVGDLFRRAGLPPGVLNVVATDDAVAGALTQDPRVDKIVFTGSVATGKRIMAAAAANLTPVVLELGGKDPAIVCADADLDQAADGIVWGAFMNAGQTCASVERVYVDARRRGRVHREGGRAHPRAARGRPRARRDRHGPADAGAPAARSSRSTWPTRSRAALWCARAACARTAKAGSIRRRC